MNAPPTMCGATLLRLRRKLRPRSRASLYVRRVLRRMRHDGGGCPPMDAKGDRRPGTFRGIIGRVLELRAHRRRPGRPALPRSLRAMRLRRRRGDRWYTSKRRRVRLLRHQLERGEIILDTPADLDELAREFATYPGSPHDDAVDALAYTLTRPR